MARRRSFRFLAAAVSGQSHQREQGHWQRSAAHQQSDQYRLEDGGQHLAAKQNLSGSTIPSIPNQVGGAHRDQGHGRQAGPLGLPHAALRDEIRGPRSSLLRDRKSTRLNSSHGYISYAVFCLKKKKNRLYVL